MPDATPPRFVHATAVVIGEAGVLIQGPSGSGKSSLALRLIADARLRGRFARLVGDDRVGVTAANGGVVAQPHPALAGRIERRSQPIATVPYERGCLVKLIVALIAADLPRLPEDGRMTAKLLDIEIPLLRLRSHTIELSSLFVLQELGVHQA